MHLNPDEGRVAKLRSAGFFTKGLVYVLIGTLTFMAAIQEGGEITSTRGAVDFLLKLPLGQFLGAVVAVGLSAYILWRIYQMLFLPGNTNSKNLKNSFKRFRFLYSGLFYGFIAYSFAKPLLSGLEQTPSTENSSGEGIEEKAALWELLATGWGKTFIWVLAAIVAGQALWQFRIAYKGKYMKKIDKDPDIKHEYDLIKKMGKIGYSARGFVFGIIAFFLVKVILQHNANAYKGTEAALQYLLQFSYGSILLGLTALGLVCYGVFNMMVAWHANLTTVN